ncbi:MAG: flagellar assembly peptidoglycan hydrolase FlgJ [Burkholderiaceae bacterium]
MNVGAGAGLAADTRGVEALRAAAARDPAAAIKEAAKQFEALFMHELMKSMRQATQSSGLLDNSTTQLGTEMLDTQFAQQMTGLRGGLSEAIARHLERQLGVALPTAGPTLTDSEAGSLSVRLPLPLAGEGWGEGRRAAHHGWPALTPALSRREREQSLNPVQAGFVQQHAQAAAAAQRVSGIPASFMIAQAAHESAWGQREIRNADGSSSHNLFGIKAGAHWKGPIAEVTTTEFIDGRAHKVKAGFRSYASAAESFNDYARLIADNPRYRRVLEQSGSAQGFAVELQRAGYATDPHYADKLTRSINTTLRVQRAAA